MKTTFLIYADAKSLLEKIHTRKNHTEKSFTTKTNHLFTCCYSILLTLLFDGEKVNITTEVKTACKSF